MGENIGPVEEQAGNTENRVEEIMNSTPLFLQLFKTYILAKQDNENFTFSNLVEKKIENILELIKDNNHANIRNTVNNAIEEIIKRPDLDKFRISNLLSDNNNKNNNKYILITMFFLENIHRIIKHILTEADFNKYKMVNNINLVLNHIETIKSENIISIIRLINSKILFNNNDVRFLEDYFDYSTYVIYIYNNNQITPYFEEENPPRIRTNLLSVDEIDDFDDNPIECDNGFFLYLFPHFHRKLVFWHNDEHQVSYWRFLLKLNTEKYIFIIDKHFYNNLLNS